MKPAIPIESGEAMIGRRTAIAILLGVPATIMGLAYLCMAMEHGTLWLFPVVVHENARYSLTETVFYFRHFLREIPIDIVYALSSVAAMRAYGPGAVLADPGTRLPWPPFVCAAAIIAIAWIGTAWEWGQGIALHELLQRYTRDEVSDYGSHWRFHLLSTVAYLASAATLSSLLAKLLQGSSPAPRPAERRRWIFGTLAVMAALTLLFRPTLEPLTDPRYLGHQFREAATHLALTLPLALGAVLAQCRSNGSMADARSGITALGGDRSASLAGERRGGVSVEIAAWWIAGAGAVAFLAIATIMTAAVGRSQPGVPLSALVCAHVCEHLLDYLFVVLLSIGLTRATAEGLPLTRPSPAEDASRLP